LLEFLGDRINMEKFIDLHTHSTASDGSYSPGELIRHAKEKGLSAVALTDHDTVEGIEEALKIGAEVGIEVIPGVEISVDYKPEMHILGYFLGDYKNALSILERLIENRNERNPKIISKLNDLGYDITMDEVKNEAKGKVVARPHVAKVLVKKGYVKSTDAAFERLLGFGKPAYFRRTE
jgi:predicted metal-dependent phosphoesterase TrpH